jgi:starch synthase
VDEEEVETVTASALRFAPLLANARIALIRSSPAATSAASPSGGCSREALNHDIAWIEQMVTKQEVIQLYSHSAVFCCPSVYEPFGIINLEAMACKAAVVASAVGGILEVVVEGETGHLVRFEADPKTGFPAHPPQFARDLAAKTTDLLNDHAKAKHYGEVGDQRLLYASPSAFNAATTFGRMPILSLWRLSDGHRPRSIPTWLVQRSTT